MGELSLASQGRLLHVLQEQEIERIGGAGRRVRIDSRVIAATNRDLAQMVAVGTFRGDLFYCLNVILLRTPALRERREDIPALANHFALKAAMPSGRKVSGISLDVLTLFQSHPWPRNVRQLENLIQRAVAMGETEYVVRGISRKTSSPQMRSKGSRRCEDSTMHCTKSAARFASRPLSLRKGTAPLPRNSTEIPCTS
jgi:transcriptional regulator with PAS, ATPase and Fis domain